MEGIKTPHVIFKLLGHQPERLSDVRRAVPDIPVLPQNPQVRSMLMSIISFLEAPGLCHQD